MARWKSVKSAPKDGRFIIGYDQNSGWPDDIEETMWIVAWRREAWRIALDGQTAEITHWMPLPEPPK